MLKSYIAALHAARYHVSSVEAAIAPMLLQAGSENEAYGKAMKAAEKKWPMRHGWTRHSAAIAEVPPSVVEVHLNRELNK